MVAKIHIHGLRDFQIALRRMDSNLPKQLRLALNEASNEVIDYAQPRFPKRTGRAASTLKARSSQREARVGLGGSRAPYAPWLDFGGRVGRNRSVQRPYLAGGRYVYRGLDIRRERITQIMGDALSRLAGDAGVEVD